MPIRCDDYTFTLHLEFKDRDGRLRSDPASPLMAVGFPAMRRRPHARSASHDILSDSIVYQPTGTRTARSCDSRGEVSAVAGCAGGLSAGCSWPAALPG